MAENTTVLSVNMKPIPPRIYQSTKIAKDHYSKIMAARPRIDTKNNQQPTISKMTDPLKIYDLVHENTRICKNLIKIEKSPCYLQMNHYMTAIPKTRKSKHSKRKGRSVSQNHKLQITNSHPKKTLVSDFMKKSNAKLFSNKITIQLKDLKALGRLQVDGKTDKNSQVSIAKYHEKELLRILLHKITSSQKNSKNLGKLQYLMVKKVIRDITRTAQKDEVDNALQAQLDTEPQRLYEQQYLI